MLIRLSLDSKMYCLSGCILAPQVAETVEIVEIVAGATRVVQTEVRSKKGSEACKDTVILLSIDR